MSGPGRPDAPGFDAPSADSVPAHCRIEMDGEGNWSYQGVPMTHQPTIDLFHQSIAGQEGEHWMLDIDGKRAPFAAALTPFLVFDLEVDEERGEVGLILNTGGRETLDPRTLFTDENNRLYCATSVSRHTVFRRNAFNKLVALVEEAQGQPVLVIGQRVLPLNIG